MLVARISGIQQAYFISQYRMRGEHVDDEAMIDVLGTIEFISPRLKQHLGAPIEMSFACARTYNSAGPTPTSDKPVLLTMNLRKNNRSFLAYLPSAPYWSIPNMIAIGSVTHVHAMFAPITRGSGELLSVYLLPEAKVDDVWAYK